MLRRKTEGKAGEGVGTHSLEACEEDFSEKDRGVRMSRNRMLKRKEKQRFSQGKTQESYAYCGKEREEK